jgi:hypothetical protein
MRLRLRLCALAALVAATPAHAQQRVGRLEGTVTEGLDSKLARTAWVSMVQLDADGATTLNPKPDERGRFRLDSIPAGRYLVQIGNAMLDSLDVALPPSEVHIQEGQTARAIFPLPSGTRLRDAICQGVQLPSGKVVVAGRTMNVDTGKPIAGATVIAAWTALNFDSANVRVVPEQRVAAVKTDDGGEYRLCGVPADRPLSLQLQAGGHASAVVRVTVSEQQGAAVQHLSISPASAPTIAELDSVEHLVVGADSTRPELALTGTARLQGTIRGAGDQPLAGAQVHLRDAAPIATTDSAGRYALDALPAGTQMLLVRQIGYAFAELPVDLRPGATATRDVALTRVTRLDSLKVVASKPAYAEFEHNRRNNALGKFLTLGEIQRWNARETSDLVRLLGDFIVYGHGPDARVVSRRASANGKCRSANIVIDKIEGLSINDVEPAHIAGMEGYADPGAAPAGYSGNADCGLIVIWMRTVGDKEHRFKDSSPLKYNGYP